MGLPAPLNKLFGILSEPGDKLEARVTDRGNKVAKLHRKRGEYKDSIVEYPNGTTVGTTVHKATKK